MVDQSTESGEFSRRSILARTAGLGAAALVGSAATGVAAADQENGRFNDSPGRGGQAVVAEEDYRDQEFEITDRSGDTTETVGGGTFQCNKGKGNRIFLVAWYFQYTDSDEEYVLYTRSNNIDTDKTFRWNPNGGKVCEDGLQSIEDGQPVVQNGVQTGYQAVGTQ